MPGAEMVDERRSRRVLVRERDRVFEVQDQAVGAGRRGLREAIRPIPGREEEDAAEADVGARSQA